MWNLTTEQFESAVKKGLGRAILRLKSNDPRPFRDQILNACLHCQVFDLQCEQHRPVYLFDLIQSSDEPNYFRNDIMKTPLEQLPERDLGQILSLCTEFAKHGDQEIRKLLYECFEHNWSKGSIHGACAIVGADELAGLLYVAERVGGEIPSDDAWYASYWIRGLKERLGDETVDHAMRNAASKNERVKAFLSIPPPEDRPSSPDEPLLSYSEVLQIQRRSSRRMEVRRWSRKASDGDIAQAAADFLTESDPQRLWIFAMIFKMRTFPANIDDLLERARNENEAISDASLSALRGLRRSEPRIRQVGLDCLIRGRFSREAFAVLTFAYQTGDNAAIQDALSRCKTQDDDDLHNIGLGLLDVFGENRTPECAWAMHWIYENDPCSLCRGFAVDRMIETGVATRAILEECLFDCQLETRKSALQALDQMGSSTC
jgi:hypothetical protein